MAPTLHNDTVKANLHLNDNPSAGNPFQNYQNGSEDRELAQENQNNMPPNIPSQGKRSEDNFHDSEQQKEPNNIAQQLAENDELLPKHVPQNDPGDGELANGNLKNVPSKEKLNGITNDVPQQIISNVAMNKSQPIDNVDEPGKGIDADPNNLLV